MLKHLLYIIFLFITAFGQVVHGSELKTDEGTIRIAISENPGGDASSVYLLNSFVTESTKKLTFLTNPKNLRNGDRISIQYREVDDSNIVYHFERHQSPQRVMARNASFVEKVLVIPVVFSKASKSYNACTVGELQNVFFPQYENQSLNVFFQAVTRGSLGFDFQMTDTISIPAPNGMKCKFAKWSDRADKKLKRRGIDVKHFDKRIYIFPSLPQCKDGAGEIGEFPDSGASLRSWLFQTCSSREAVFNLVAHELGHNLGLQHANLLDPSTGSMMEYGDTSDFMGSSGTSFRLLNSVHTEFLGFLNGQDVVAVNDFQSPQRFVLSPLNSDLVRQTRNPRLLKIPVGNDEFLYISYRVGDGFDHGISSEHRNKIAIHRNKSFDAQSLLVRTVGQDEIYFDKYLHLSLKVHSLTPEAADIGINFDVTCTRSRPRIVLAQKKLFYNGHDSLRFDVEVTNRDEGCSDREFNLDIQSPDNLAYFANQATMTLASGEKRSFEVYVVPLASTLSGRHKMKFTVATDDFKKTLPAVVRVK